MSRYASNKDYRELAEFIAYSFHDLKQNGLLTNQLEFLYKIPEDSIFIHDTAVHAIEQSLPSKLWITEIESTSCLLKIRGMLASIEK